jgi:hypothetical protein
MALTRQTPRQPRADFEIEKVAADAEQEQIIDTLNKLINSLNFTNKFLTIQGNFEGYIAENVIIKANSKAQIQHFLGVKPKWRIILRQTGNGVVTDIPSEWTDKYITLYNNGSVDVTVSLFIARE